MKCYRKNGSDCEQRHVTLRPDTPSMKCYRKNGSDTFDLLYVDADHSPQ